MALRCVSAGADVPEAIIVAESVKAATTASALIKGTPIQPAGEAAQQLVQLAQQRESIRLRSVWHPNDPKIASDLKRLDAQLAQERRDISLRDPRYGRWVDATDIDISNMRALLRRLQKLGANTTLMGVWPIGDTVWTYMLWEGGSTLSQQLLPPPLQASSRGDGSGTPVSSFDQEFLKQISSALFAPHVERLREISPNDLLIISVHQRFNLIPFSALPIEGLLLCQRARISLTPGTGILEASLAKGTRAADSAICLGDPLRPDTEQLVWSSRGSS